MSAFGPSRGSLLLAAAAALLSSSVSWPGRALAAQAVAPDPADTSLAIEFTIPSLPLDEALAAFSRASGWTVTVIPRDAGGHASGLVRGRFTPPQALARLLEGTPYIGRFRDDGSVTLDRDPNRIQGLATLTVVASREATYRSTESHSALRTPTPLRDTPQAVAVVGRELIEDRAMQGLDEALEFIPGARMGQGEGNRDQPTLRGNGSTSAFFTDGMRDDVQYVRDLYNVQRVEGVMGANALSFGRGVSGGVINRVTKRAGLEVRELQLSAGSYGARRGTADIGAPVGGGVSLRLNAMYENSDLFRRGVSLERFGIHPATAIRIGSRTVVTASLERFGDDRVADRGIPSFDGEPVPVDRRTFFGNPGLSPVSIDVTLADAAVTHQLGSATTLVSRTRWADYDKFYQNVFPTGTSADGTVVRIAAYNNATVRTNLFNQTEVIMRGVTGPARHTLLAGVVVGRQVTENLRHTGYFDDAATAIEVPLVDPVTTAPVTFRQSATDADNRVEATTISAYLQDQVALGSRWQVIGGVRIERFALDYQNRRNATSLRRTDVMVSPRAGLVFRAARALSLYASYGVAALPSAGDQFASLNATTSTLEPETFTNHEVGLKWDAGSSLAITVAAYQLDRNKSRAPDPADPTRSVQTGSQRSRGIEVGVQGRVTAGWSVAGAYALQDAEITARTSAANVGAEIPLVPQHAASLWNRIAVRPRLAVGLGLLHQGESFASLDNAVALPAYTRVDAAVFLGIAARVDVQVNVENVLDTRYYRTSHNNHNISPGSPRAFRVGVTSRF